MSSLQKKQSRKSKLVPKIDTECFMQNPNNVAVTIKEEQIEVTDTTLIQRNCNNIVSSSGSNGKQLHLDIDIEVEEYNEDEEPSRLYTKNEANDEEKSKETEVDSKIETDEDLSDSELQMVIDEEAIELSKVFNKANDKLEDIDDKLDEIDDKLEEIDDKLEEIDDKLDDVEVEDSSEQCQELSTCEVQSQYANVFTTLASKHNVLGINKVAEYHCSPCNINWLLECEFRSHLEGIHPSSEGSKFVTKPTSKGHQVICLFDYVCPDCRITFPSVTALKTHRNMKGYLCHRCFRILRMCSAMTYHVCLSIKPSLLGNKQDVGMLYKCIICRVLFYDESHLVEHCRKVHTVCSDELMPCELSYCMKCDQVYPGLKVLHYCPKRRNRYRCKFCSGSFQTMLFLKVHNKAMAHNGDKECPSCGVQFANNCLKRVHDCSLGRNINMSQCMLCARLFSDDTDVREHVVNKHNIKPNLVDEAIVVVNLGFKKMVSKSAAQNANPIVLPTVGADTDDTNNPNTDLEDEDDNTEAEANEDHPIVNRIKSEPLDGPTEDIEIEIKQEVQDDEYSLPIDIVIKEEPVDMKAEPDYEEEFEDDIIMLNTSDELITIEEENKSAVISNIKIMSNGKMKKLYDCKKCAFKGLHGEYRKHQNKCFDRERKAQRRRQQIDSIIKAHDSTFKCLKCSKEFTDFSYFICHYRFPDTRAAECPFCGITDYGNFGRHILHHTKQCFSRVSYIVQGRVGTNKTFQCRVCSEHESKKRLIEHWLTHTNIDKAVCKAKSDTFRNTPPVVSDMQDRADDKSLANDVVKEAIKVLGLRTRYGKYKTCKICLKDFDRMNDIKRHVIEHMLDDALARKAEVGSLACQICGVCFEKISMYKQHMRDHGELPVYQCQICDKTFSDSSNFAKHRKVHNLQVLICDICMRKFNSKKMLIVHMEEHTRNKPIPCEECNKIFFFNSAYKKHVRVVHEKVALKYPCRICHVRFPSVKDKWNHCWEVHKERKEKADCPYCDAAFRRYTDVKRHIETEHTGTGAIGNKKYYNSLLKKLKRKLKS